MQRPPDRGNSDADAKSGDGVVDSGLRSRSGDSKDIGGYPGSLKKCMSSEALQWLAIGMAIASEQIRAELDIGGFAGAQADLLSLIKQKRWNETGALALKSGGVSAFAGEKIAASVVETIRENAIARRDAQAAYIARVNRKQQSGA